MFFCGHVQKKKLQLIKFINITNPHNSFTVKLAKLDGTVLDTQVLNDASSFFLQYTEVDYGTYDYQVLLNDTRSRHIRTRGPAPNQLLQLVGRNRVYAISADLSSITGAHPDFTRTSVEATEQLLRHTNSQKVKRPHRFRTQRQIMELLPIS